MAGHILLSPKHMDACVCVGTCCPWGRPGASASFTFRHLPRNQRRSKRADPRATQLWTVAKTVVVARLSRQLLAEKGGDLSPPLSLSLLPSSLGRWLLSLTRTRSPSIEKWRERTRRIHLIRWIITGDRGGSSFQGNSNFCSNNPFFNDEHHEI